MNTQTFIKSAYVGYMKKYGSSSNRKDGRTDKESSYTNGTAYPHSQARVERRNSEGKAKGRNSRPAESSKGRKDGRRALPIRKGILQLRGKGKSFNQEARKLTTFAFPFFFSTPIISTPWDTEYSKLNFPEGLVILALLIIFPYLLSRKLDIQKVIWAFMYNEPLEFERK